MSTSLNNQPLQDSIHPESQTNPEPLESNAIQVQLNSFLQNPVAFIQEVATSVIDTSAEKHLADLREEMELKAAIRSFSKQNADFLQFRPYILHELATLLENDPDGYTASWDELLVKAARQFKTKLKTEISNAVKQSLPTQMPPPLIESGTIKKMSENPPEFSRKDIANMNLEEFLKNEAFIDEAMRQKRIY